MTLKRLEGGMRKEGERLDSRRGGIIAMKYMLWIHVYLPPTTTNKFFHLIMNTPSKYFIMREKLLQTLRNGMKLFQHAMETIICLMIY